MKKISYRLAILIAVIICVTISCGKEGDFNEVLSPDNKGQGGSMARFAIVGNYLYVIDNQELKVFDIQNTSEPVYKKDVDIGFGIETVWPYGGYLFIGSTSGMYIYNITTPESPVLTGTFEHVTSCDPVVVNDSLAFVTLRTTSECRNGWGANQLDIIDIRNLTNPQLLKSHSLSSPYGLGLDEEYLFICHGTEGLGIYSFDEDLQLSNVNYLTGINAYDLILRNKRALVIGETGFYQYNYSNIDSIYLMSSILKGE